MTEKTKKSLEEILNALNVLNQIADEIFLETDRLAIEIRDALNSNVDVASLADEALKDDDALSIQEKMAIQNEEAEKAKMGGHKTEQPEFEIW